MNAPLEKPLQVATLYPVKELVAAGVRAVRGVVQVQQVQMGPS
ncbi:hypothetical protein ACSNOI_34235 [Actinomadura kijaniata]